TPMTWLRNFLTRDARTRRGGSRRPGPCPLNVEELENRRVPATVAAGPHGEVFATFAADHELWELNATGWHYLDSNVTAISVGGDGSLDAVFTDASLWKLDSLGWHWLDGNVHTTAAGPHGEVFAVVAADHELWELD